MQAARDNSPTTDTAPATSADPNQAHVVSVIEFTDLAQRRWFNAVASQTLDAERCEAVERFLNHEPGEPDYDGLLEWTREHASGGLAILSTERGGRPAWIPRPLTVSFEPVRLRETEPRLCALLDALELPDSISADRLRPSVWMRALLNWGLPLAGAALLVGLFGVVLQATPGWMSAVFAAAALPAVVYNPYRRWAWRLVPGGVIARVEEPSRRLFGHHRRRAGFFPENAVLHLSRNADMWLARLVRPGIHITRGLTEMERILLLAAWQSTSRPPVDWVRRETTP